VARGSRPGGSSCGRRSPFASALGYLTFLDTLLISAFLVTAVVLILAVYLRRQDMKGRKAFVAKVDRYVILFYAVAYIGTMATVTLLFR